MPEPDDTKISMKELESILARSIEAAAKRLASRTDGANGRVQSAGDGGTNATNDATINETNSRRERRNAQFQTFDRKAT